MSELQTLARKAVEALTARKMTLTTVESCTGGMISSALVDVPGASEVLMQGLVTYSNTAKMRYVGVKNETLTEHGAVSDETVREMAEGGCAMGGTDAAVAVSGIAGPGGGTPEKPVGLVYLAASVKGVTLSEECHFPGDRSAVRTASAEAALRLLLEALAAAEN